MLHQLPYTGSLPEKFTFPFCYQPHPAAVMAAEKVQEYLRSKEEWQEELQRGKMFGVLVVQSPECRVQNAECRVRSDFSAQPTLHSAPCTLNYIAAYSGLLAGRNDHEFFVPPVFDSQQPDGYFKTHERRISALSKGGRQTRSHSIALQRWLFAQYNIINVEGERRNLIDIFNEHYAGLKGRKPAFMTEADLLPPSGAGDCCAPKLLQYAFLHNLKPVCMAEFWWGDSPKGEIRHHLQYYPACTGKCKPILRHMLKGLDVERNPHEALVQGKLEIIHEDEAVVIVNKPAGMLSVPGNIDAPDVVSSLTPNLSPTGEGSDYTLIPVHRLDMATSGLLMLAKSDFTCKLLQYQFARHEVKKEYVAVVEREMTVGEKGRITLPLNRDLDNRPCQKVDYERGRSCLTEYEVIAPNRLLLKPLTGRTHQLRVHCAHPDGLNNPIVGDPLYGKPGNRLLLHSQRLEFIHPYTKERMEFTSKPDF